MKRHEQGIEKSLLECGRDSQNYSDERQKTAEKIDALQQKMNDVNIPVWDKSQVLSQVQPQREPQWSLLPWLSMSFSFVAICMVVFNLNIQTTQQGISIAFGSDSSSKLSSAEVESIIEERIKQYQSDNELQLAQLVMQMQEQQNQSNLKLATYLLDSARTERQQDISDVFMHFNDQMAEQKSLQKIQFQQLEQAVKYQKTGFSNSRL